MNSLKTTLLLIGISSFSYSFSQTVEQDFSHLDKNKDGKIDKTEFKNSPPAPAPKKASSEGATRSTDKSNAAPGKAAEEKAQTPPPSFDSLDINKDGVIDMDEYKMSPMATRKRPGSQKNTKD